MRLFFIFILFLGFVLPNGLTFGTDTSTQWKGHSEIKNGIRVVKNPDKPVFGQITLAIKEELVLTHGEKVEDVLGGELLIALDGTENIYIMDSQQYRGLSFTKNGTYRFQFGGKGTGPGQFRSIYDLWVDKTGNIYVLDERMIHTFDHTGKPAGQIKLNQTGHDFFINEKKQYIISFIAMDSTLTFKEQVLGYSSVPLKIEKELARYGMGRVVKQTDGKKMISYNLSHIYTPSLCFARSTDNTCIFGFSNHYQLSVVDEKGTLQRVIENADAGTTISSQEKQILADQYSKSCAHWPKQMFKEALQFPDKRPYFQHILLADGGLIFVARVLAVQKNQEQKRAYLFDVYTREGYFIYHAQLPVSPDIIWNGNLYYTDSSNEDEEIAVKRCKITNWQTIKSCLIK